MEKYVQQIIFFAMFPDRDRIYKKRYTLKRECEFNVTRNKKYIHE